MKYPLWLYAADDKSQLVRNEEEEKALGDGWYTHPSLIPTPEQLAAKKKADDEAAKLAAEEAAKLAKSPAKDEKALAKKD